MNLKEVKDAVEGFWGLNPSNGEKGGDTSEDEKMVSNKNYGHKNSMTGKKKIPTLYSVLTSTYFYYYIQPAPGFPAVSSYITPTSPKRKPSTELVASYSSYKPTSTASTYSSVASANPTDNNDVPDAALIMASGYPGYQYSIVDPDSQFQKYLIVVIQALSGTDPLNPPPYSATLTQDGTILSVNVPMSHMFTRENLMLNQKVSWMTSRTKQDYVATT